MRRVVIVFSAVLALVASAAGPVSAQESAMPGSPSEVVKAAFDAMNELNWELYATYMHPEALAEYKGAFWPIVQAKFADTANDISKIQLLLGVGRDESGKLPDYPAADFFSNSLLQITEAVPQLKEQLSRGKTEVLGDVPEGEKLVHVVVRLTYTMMGREVSEVKVATVKESAEGWRLLLSTEMKTLAAGMAQMISQ